MDFRVSIVIVTMNRQKDLFECVESVKKQTVKSSELVVVDAGEASGIKENLQEILHGTAITPKYYKTAPSTSAQRNFGIKRCSGDIIFFFDDDVVLDDDYIEKVLDVYRRKDAGGVGGLVKNHRKCALMRMLFDILFMLDGQTVGKTIQFPSGKFLVNYSPASVSQTMVLNGCCMSFRRDILSEFAFDESLKGYAFKEDQDLSYRVSTRYSLWETPHARLVHKVSPVNRLKARVLNKQRIINDGYLFRKNFNKSLFQRVCFWWSQAGLLALSVYAGARHMTFDPIFGVLEGVGELFKSKHLLYESILVHPLCLRGISRLRRSSQQKTGHKIC